MFRHVSSNHRAVAGDRPGWAAGPTLAGYAMQHVALALPLFIGGTIKIVYDVLLHAAFRGLKPPEERK